MRDQLYVKDSRTSYLSVLKNVEGLSLSGIYGITDYGDYEKSKICVWAGYNLTDALKLSAVLP